MSGETTPTGSRGIPFATVGGRGAVERAGLRYQHKGIIHVRAASVRTPILGHIDPACNTSYHFAASRTVLPRVPPYLARDRLRLLAHVYDRVASIHMTKNPGRHG